MNNLLANTIQQEIEALQAQLDTIEERAAALRATIAQYKETIAAEQQTAADALLAAKNAQETALSALVAAKAAQDLLAAIPTAAEQPVETPFCASPEASTDDTPEEEEVEIELVYEEDEAENAVETPFMPSPEEEVEEEEVEIELVYEEDEADNAVETPFMASPDEEEEPTEKPAEEVAVEEPVKEVTEKPASQVHAPQTSITGAMLPPITDIRKAISLGDRFLFQRELFAGNGELMNKTIDNLNSLSNLEDALAYIDKNFTWDTESQAYELFMNILKRRW